MTLTEYARVYSNRGECQCGQCIDRGNKLDPQGHVADLMFFKVALKADPNAETLKRLIADHKPEFNDPIDLFDGNEHGYMEIGAWIGDQSYTLVLMGMGHLLGLWDLLTPNSVMPDLPADLKMQMAGAGMISIRATKDKN